MFQAYVLPVQAGSDFKRQSPITVLEQTAGSITLQISTGNLRRRTISGEGRDFQVLGVESFGFLQETGLPMLPGTSEFLVTAPGTRVCVTILRSEVRELKGVKIYPAQEERTAGDGEMRDYPFQINRQFYRNSVYYPAKPVQTGQAMVMVTKNIKWEKNPP